MTLGERADTALRGFSIQPSTSKATANRDRHGLH